MTSTFQSCVLSVDEDLHDSLIEDVDLYKQPILDLILAALVRPAFLDAQRDRHRLDNHDIVKLSSRCLSANVLVQIIEVSETDFEVSPRSLLSLRKCGVGDRVIEAMLLKQCKTGL